MAKREIVRALKRKGLAASECYYAWQVGPGWTVPCWTIELDDDSVDFLEARGVPEMDIGKVFFDTAAQVMEWIASLPSNYK